MSSDAIVVLKADHKEIRSLFRKFQAAGDRAVKKKAKIAGQIIELLTVHTYIENEVMYPEVCALLPNLKDDVLEAWDEHHVADVLCMELARKYPGRGGTLRRQGLGADRERHPSHGRRSRTGSPRSGPASAANSCRNSAPSSSGPGRKRRDRRPSPVR